MSRPAPPSYRQQHQPRHDLSLFQARSGCSIPFQTCYALSTVEDQNLMPIQVDVQVRASVCYVMTLIIACTFTLVLPL